MLRLTVVLASFLAIGPLLACGDGDTPQASQSATPESTIAVTPLLPPIPADWPTYRDPDGRFSIRYPSTWFASDGELYSADPRTMTGPGPRPDTVNVEISFNPATQSNTCGAESVDPQTGEVSNTLAEATAVFLGSQPAWQLVRTAETSDLQGNTRIQVISLVYNEQCVLVSGYFTQREPDVTTFLQMASTFEFKI